MPQRPRSCDRNDYHDSPGRPWCRSRRSRFHSWNSCGCHHGSSRRNGDAADYWTQSSKEGRKESFSRFRQPDQGTAKAEDSSRGGTQIGFPPLLNADHPVTFSDPLDLHVRNLRSKGHYNRGIYGPGGAGRAPGRLIDCRGRGASGPMLDAPLDAERFRDPTRAASCANGDTPSVWRVERDTENDCHT